MDCSDIAVLILVKTDAFDKVRVHQAHFVAREETIILFRRFFHKVVALDPELAAKRNLTLAQIGVFEVIVRLKHLNLVLGIVVDDELKRMENCQHALAAGLKILTDTVLESCIVRGGVALGNAAQVDKALDGGRCVAPAAQAGDGDQTRVVPAVDNILLDKLFDIALTGDLVCQIHLGKLDLSGRMRILSLAHDPVVQRTVVLKFQCAEGVGDPLYGVLDRVSKIVHGIDAPLVTGRMVRHTVNDRVAHVDVGACHIDLCPQCLLTVRKLAGAHALKEIEVFLNAPLAVGVIFAGFCQGAAILAHLFRGQVGDIGLALFDELDCDIVHLLEIV